ncbi:hypothetical protein EST62_12930 [Chlorobaculum sp. 24CR]|uniref:hypothetical protein n=1 Tax=Chlorobaculum sp. 24CR TaxID=2508878 RepID=UPI00100A384C|nr:hypothetical protein [Chlorobaculum sp. 24CR]RXK80158.1 hypothetical protein EST62_12930 [Chlorobaculum sp. 24CR]
MLNYYTFIFNEAELRGIYPIEIKENYTAQAEQNEILKRLYKEFCENCISVHGKLLLQLPPMTIAIRRELDNDNDSKIFEEALYVNRDVAFF